MIKTMMILFTVISTYSAFNPLQPSSGTYLPDPIGDGHLLSITDYTVTPELASTVIPSDLKIDAYSGDGRGYYLVILNGPVFQFMQDRLTETGAFVLGCHSRNLFIVHMNDEIRRRVNDLPFVIWSGIYQPAYKFYRSLTDGTADARFLVYLFYTEDPARHESAVKELGFEVLDRSSRDGYKFIYVQGPRARIADLARLDPVCWIEEWHPSEPENNQTQWVNQKGISTTDTLRTVWRQGILGTNEVLGYTDTGLDVNHWAFRDPVGAITDTGEFPAQRKIVVFKHYPAASGVGDPDGHGTHVGGTIGGSDSAMGGTDPRDGHSKNARIVHLSPIPTSSYNFITVFNVITNNLRNPQLRPHTISNSWWTGTMGQYTAKSSEVDHFCWTNRDIVIIKSCGNQGQTSQYRITEPGNAKSVVSAAATGTGSLANTLASYSSRGPAPDGRVKPDLATPGDVIFSVSRNTTNSYVSMSGTSMAAPSTNGCVGLIREYLRTGFYPSGARNPADSMGYVSSALLRAMLIVSCDPNVAAYVVPSEYIGWGRIDLDSVLYFSQPTADRRKLMLYDNTTGLVTGQFHEYQFLVTDSTVPLRATVCWTDTAAAAGATRALINNLDARMVAANNDSFKGNVYSGGQSVLNPTARYDSLNPLECFRVNLPRTGTWRLRVMAANVVTQPQPYALVITGAIQPVIGIAEATGPAGPGDRLILGSFKPNPARIGRISIRFFSPATIPRSTVKIYDIGGSLVRTLYDGSTVGWQESRWDGKDENGRLVRPGVYFVRLAAGADEVTRKTVLVR